MPPLDLDPLPHHGVLSGYLNPRVGVVSEGAPGRSYCEELFQLNISLILALNDLNELFVIVYLSIQFSISNSCTRPLRACP